MSNVIADDESTAGSVASKSDVHDRAPTTIAISGIDDVRRLARSPTNMSRRSMRRVRCAWASMGSSRDSRRRPLPGKRSQELEPPTARAGSSGAGFFHHVKEVRRVSPSIAPGRAPEARSRKQFSAPGLDGGAALAVKTSRCARPYGLRIKFFSCPPRRPSMLCTQETSTKGAIMGLDMTAYAVPAGASKGEQFHYWRKHHELLKWCAALDIERGGATWDEPAQSIILTSADLDRLESAVVKGEVRGFLLTVAIIGRLTT